MANMKDFFSDSGNQTTASMAYLLLMANVLGIAIFIDGKKSLQSPVRERKNKKLQMTQTVKPVSPIDDKHIVSEIPDEIMRTTEEIIEEKSEENQVVFDQVEQIAKQNNKEVPKLRDNIIDFKEAVASRTQETKQPLKPLIWHFPKK